MCSFQVTSRSENVNMMAVLMGQSSSEKHTQTIMLILYTHVHTEQKQFTMGKSSKEVSDGPASCLGVMD